MKVICSSDDIQKGVRALRRRCPVMAKIHARNGDPPLRRYPADIAGLARIIVGQQLSIASAAAIWARVERSLGDVSADRLAGVRAETLKSAGLSTPKIRALKSLAEAVRWGGLDISALQKASDDDVHAALTAVSGIGPWTADIFIMFCLGRADAWAAGDLALQVGVARAFELGERLSAEEASKVAERWRPWRGVAARLIWADYANLRRSGSGDPLAPKLVTPARKRTLRD